jgi:Adaptive response protein AidB N-terminal domain
MRELAAIAERPETEPTLVQYDQWGKRVDKMHTSEGWRALKAIAAEEGSASHPTRNTKQWVLMPRSYLTPRCPG